MAATAQQFTGVNLERRMEIIAHELKRYPDESILDAVPYWKKLHVNIISEHGSLEAFYRRLPQIDRPKEPFPSPQQEDAAAQIMQRKRILIRDAAGYGKSAPALLASCGIEEILGEKNLVTMIVCPTYVTSSWEQKLQIYTPGRKFETITSANRKSQLSGLSAKLNDGLSTIIIGYDALFRHPYSSSDSILDIEHIVHETFSDCVDVADALLKIASERKVHLIGDETHHVKTATAKRSIAFRKLALKAEYFTALTASPFFDSIDDIYELISLMQNQKYPTAREARSAFRDNPRLIRSFMLEFQKDPVCTLDDLPGMPPLLPPDDRWIEISKQERQIYDAVRGYTEFVMGEKFVLMQLATTDARLIHPDTYPGGRNLRKKIGKLFLQEPWLNNVVAEVSSTKYSVLTNIVNTIAQKNEKALIFSAYREGITKELTSLYAARGAVCIDGSVSADAKGKLFSERDIRRLTLQTDPDATLGIATIASVREGMDLHALNHAIYLNRMWSPAEVDQSTGRERRRGQKLPVCQYFIGCAHTHEEGIDLTQREKRKGCELVDDGIVPSAEQADILESGPSPLRMKPIVEHLRTPREDVWQMIGSMINKGADQNSNLLGIGRNAEIYANGFNLNWQYSYSAHTNRLIASLLKDQGLQDGRIIDICSPASLSRVLLKPSLCVDINRFQLEIGKRESARLGVDVETLLARAENLSMVESASRDVAVLSLGLHYGNWSRGDRKRMLLEAHRILKPGGTFELALPTNILAEDGPQLLLKGLEAINYRIDGDRTGYARAIDGNSDFRVYVCTAQRLPTNNDSALYSDDRYNELFILNPLLDYIDFKKAFPIEKKKAAASLEKDIHQQFVFDNGYSVAHREERSVPTTDDDSEMIAKIIFWIG